MDLTHLPWNLPTEYDDRPCLADEAVRLTYREFRERADAIAEQFAQHGVGRGDVVAIMLPNRVELLLAMAAAWRLGAAATPINPTFTAAEAGHQITDSGAALVVTGDGVRVADRPALAADALQLRPQGILPAPATAPADLALLIYTSGSTGRPKGVMLSHGNVAAMVASMGAHIGVTADDHCLLVLPLFHVNAICVSFLTPYVSGGRTSMLQRFHPVEFLAAIQQVRPTYFSAVPTIYAHLVALPEELTFDVSSVRYAVCGAAPAAPDLLAAVERRFGFPMIEGYGLSEGTCASTCNPLDGVRKAGTVGIALPGQTVAIMAPDGTLLPAGERGEVVISGDNVMQGYLGRPEESAQALGGGWLHTGDVGLLDEEGYLRIVDRIKDMIIRGGENLYPKEIENVLHADPAVFEAAVVGAPDEVYGEVPVAFLAPAPGHSIDVPGVLERCRAELAKVKVPVAVHVLEALPKNPVGKIDKPTLRARLGALTMTGA